MEAMVVAIQEAMGVMQARLQVVTMTTITT